MTLPKPSQREEQTNRAAREKYDQGLATKPGRWTVDPTPSSRANCRRVSRSGPSPRTGWASARSHPGKTLPRRKQTQRAAVRLRERASLRGRRIRSRGKGCHTMEPDRVSHACRATFHSSRRSRPLDRCAHPRGQEPDEVPRCAPKRPIRHRHQSRANCLLLPAWDQRASLSHS